MKVLHDLFPAFIVVTPPNVVEDFRSVIVTPSHNIPGARYIERVRLVVSEDEKSKIVMIAQDHHAGPRLIFADRVSDLNWSGNKSDDSQLITRQGKIVAFKYQRGCNCGSRLRSWSPYQTMDSIKDPTS